VEAADAAAADAAAEQRLGAAPERCRTRAVWWHTAVTIVRSVVLFVLAALAGIGGAWLIWQGVREHKGVWWIGAGIAALGAYGFVATLQADANFGRILAAYGGVFVAGSLGYAGRQVPPRPLRPHRCAHLPRRGRSHHVRAKDLTPDRLAMRTRPRLGAGARSPAAYGAPPPEGVAGAAGSDLAGQHKAPTSRPAAQPRPSGLWMTRCPAFSAW
jgi:small multidrug resistance family-3 protein